MKNPFAAVRRRLARWSWRRTSNRFYESARRHIPVIRQRFAASLLEIETISVGRGSAAYVLSTEHLGGQPVVYSCGVGAEISFDLAMLADYGATVYAFDPTAEAAMFVESQPRPARFHFQQIGISGNDGMMEIQTIQVGHRLYRPATLLNLGKSSRARTSVPVKSLPTLMKELGHTQIAVLKVDIEGGEYDMIQSWPADWAPARQIAMEWHPGLWNMQAGKPMEAEDGWQVTFNSLQLLVDRGYRIFHISDRGTEMSLLLQP